MTTKNQNSLLDAKVWNSLEQYAIVHSVIECNPDWADTVEFVQHYPYTAGQSANTLIVAGKVNPLKYAICVVLATTKLDVNKKVCQLLDVKRASFARSDQTLQLTGMKIGGVTAFGLPDGLPIFIDAAVMKNQQVVMGGGNRTSKLVLDPRELLKLPNVEIVENLANQK